MKTISNRVLLAIFVVLAAVVAVVLIYDNRKGERSFRSELFVIDSAQVTSIAIYPKGENEKKILLARSGNVWDVHIEDQTYSADTTFIRSLLQTVTDLVPERVAALGSSSWNEFQVSDSTGTHVVVSQGEDPSADFWVGKISFSQQPQASAYGRNQNPSVKSHIRVEGDDKVYLVDGFLSMMFPEQVSRYRERTICRFDKDLPTTLTFSYPGDSSFIMTKSNGSWLINGVPADSAAMENYLRSLSSTMGNEFAPDDLQPIYGYRLTIEGMNMPVIEVQGAIDTALKIYMVHSGVNPTSVFISTNPSVFNRIFVTFASLISTDR